MTPCWQIAIPPTQRHHTEILEFFSFPFHTTPIYSSLHKFTNITIRNQFLYASTFDATEIRYPTPATTPFTSMQWNPFWPIVVDSILLYHSIITKSSPTIPSSFSVFSSFHSKLCWLCSYSLISATSHKPHQVYFTAYGCNVLHLSPHPFHFLPFHFFLHFFPLLSLFFTNHCSPSFTCIRVNYWKLSDVLHSLYIFGLIPLNLNLHYPYYYPYSYS